MTDGHHQELKFCGRFVMVGFGAIGQGVLPLLLRHIAMTPQQLMIVTADESGILIRSPSSRGVAEEAPLAYKDVSAVVDASDHAGLARKVVRLTPLICIKG